MSLVEESKKLADARAHEKGYPLYPVLSELGKLESEEFIENLKSKIRTVVNDALGEIYVDLPDYIESDSWTNYRNTLLAGLCNYQNKEHSRYDFQKIRQTIYAEFKEEINKDLNQDLLEEVADLKKRLEEEREYRRRWNSNLI
jgi:hypothetical protein